MKIIIGHLMCSLLFKMMMLIVHAWLTSLFSSSCRLHTVVWDPGWGGRGAYLYMEGQVGIL